MSDLTPMLWDRLLVWMALVFVVAVVVFVAVGFIAYKQTGGLL